MVKHPGNNKGLVLLPRRWVVERSFVWASPVRWLAKDYEQLPETGAGCTSLPSRASYSTALCSPWVRVYAGLARQGRVCKHNRGCKGGSSERGGTVNLGSRPTRRRSASVTIGVTAVLVATLSGCSVSAEEEEYDYGAVCVDQRTQVRVGDDLCDDDGPHGWYYIPAGSRAQAVGERVSGGSFNPPPPGEQAYLGGVSPEGGVVSRGGFGGNSDSVGG